MIRVFYRILTPSIIEYTASGSCKIHFSFGDSVYFVSEDLTIIENSLSIEELV